MSIIESVRNYLMPIIKDLNSNIKNLNVDMLSEDVNSYSLEKIPSEPVEERWITGAAIYKEQYSLRSRNAYSQDTINNLNNIGFFERFQNKIEDNNEKGILPNIDGIESIECLNCGTMLDANTNDAVFDIQIQITYRN